MANVQETIQRLAGMASRHRGLILPITAVVMLLVVLVPLPPGVLDLLLAANIALAAVVLLTTIHAGSALEFSVFPAVLLGTTLMRLVLNIATTRLILTAGEGRDVAAAQLAAGKVVWAFSSFVTGQSNVLAVGVVLFAIIAVIQFVVITKGATRVSEVAARFVLDAMPGKQMAIDSDLNAGLINEDQARARRLAIGQEADFYGAMDGASKFLRGDAVAAVLIMVVNILGGLYIGKVHYGWEWSATLDLFTRLTIGEGLVMQVPAFLISISAALIVTRGGGKSNLGDDVVRQLTAKPVALAITGGFLGLLSLTSLPKLPLLMLGVGCAGLAWVLSRRQGLPQAQPKATSAMATGPAVENVEELLAVDPLRLELGYSLVRLVDAAQGGDLLDRVSTLRRQIAGELGLVVPPIRIRDDLRLDARHYVIKIRGEGAAGGRIYPGQFLAICGETAPAGKLTGRQCTDPVTGRPAVWIDQSQRDHAQMMNYTVLDAADALIRHLSEVIHAQAAQLLTRQQVTKLLDGVKVRAGNLVGEVTEKLRVGQIQKVLQNLLRERVPIRDLESILEALGEAAGHTDDTDVLTESVRASLGRTLCRQYCGKDGKLWCVCLDGELEEAIGSYVGQGRASAVVPPELASRVTKALSEALGDLKRQGRRPVVLCAPQIRPVLRKLISPASPEAAVLAYSEIESTEVQSTATIGVGI